MSSTIAAGEVPASMPGTTNVRATPKITRPRRTVFPVIREDFVSDTANLSLDGCPRTPSPWSSPGSDFELDTPFIGEESYRTEYETTVNMGLVALLCAIRLHCPELVAGHWLPDPKLFELCDSSGAILWAHVDGYLSKKGHGNTAFGIIEVKPYTRHAKRVKIEQQKAAQMAAWISQTPGELKGNLKGAPGSNIRREIFITVAEYGTEYEEYISKYSKNDPTTADYSPDSTSNSISSTSNNTSAMYGTPTPAPRICNQAGSQVGHASGNSGSSGSRAPPLNLHNPKTGRALPKSGQNVAYGGKQATGPGSSKAFPSMPKKYPNRGFLKMTTYSPASLTNPSEMVRLCKLIAALSMQVLRDLVPPSSF
ncbi:hypothetical protein Sste5346_000576 [Sporothrix stenoceras]|uniref:Fungal-type protein kinase domain-containing protein n=1 Tax=Sporothrix stenoceras TaxID=5173 RepID=A0ABR3ZRI2_9PEZI